MREKYIEEKFRRYFILGEYPKTGNVDVCDSEGDIVTNVSQNEAVRLIADRNKVVDALIKCIQSHGTKDYEVFKTL